MKNSLVLSTTVKYLIPLLMIFSFFLLLRGHNEPGGGFTGGLVAAAAYALYSIANGIEEAKKFLRIDPLTLISIGLLVALLSGISALLDGMNFLTGIWFKFEFPLIGKIGTPLIFDIGVYIVVLGISSMIIFSLAEEEN